MKTKITTISLFLLASILFGCTNHYKKILVTKSPEISKIIIQNVDIFNGKDKELILNQDVLIQDGKIQKIASKIDFEISTKTRVINGKGKTLMPGFIDSHVHLSGSGSVPWESVKVNTTYNLSAYLYSGITTIYDLGGMAKSMKKIAKKIEKGDIIGPSLYHTHIPITIKNSHPVPLTKEVMPFPLKYMVNAIVPTIDKVEEAPDLMEKYVKKGVDFVKIICDEIPPGSPQMSYEQLKALIDEAHKLNKKVFVHIGSPQNAVDAAKAGADVLAHGIWRGKLTELQADTIASYNIPVIYTLAAFQNVNHIFHGEFKPNELDKHLVPEKVLTPVTSKNGKDVEKKKAMHGFFKDVADKRPDWEHNFKLLHDRKVPILVGTDSNLPGTYAGSTYIQEMFALKKYGMSNYEILKGATYLNSILFLENPNFGTVEEGKKANLLLFNGNPLEDLELVRIPDLIIKGGEIIIKQ